MESAVKMNEEKSMGRFRAQRNRQPTPEEILRRLQRDLEAVPEDKKSRIVDRYLIKYPNQSLRIRELQVNPGEFDDDRTVLAHRPSMPQNLDPDQTQIAQRSHATQPKGNIPDVGSRALDVPRVDLPASAPRFLGTYRIIKELGRGGMGVVYLGMDDSMARLVAIKVLPAEFSQNPEYLERFRREQGAISRLQHPGIIPIYATGEQDGLHYFVMQFVRGKSLGLWLKEFWTDEGLWQSEESGITKAEGNKNHEHPERTLGQFLYIVERCAIALHFAHGNGILHRDIKPGNIVVDDENNPIILDFGLAKQESEQTITKTGNILGTVPFMSPEQITANHGEIDHRSDLYSLGVILYQGLTGQLPFQSKRFESLMTKIISREAVPPRKLNPELSQDLEVVTLKCLEKDPHRRFANCQALAEDLGRIRAHQSILAEPIGPLGRVHRWAKRNRLQAAISLVLLIVLGFFGAFVAQRKIAAQRLEEESAKNLRTIAMSLLKEANDWGEKVNRFRQERERAFLGKADMKTGRKIRNLGAKIKDAQQKQAGNLQRAVEKFDDALKSIPNEEAEDARQSALRSWFTIAEDNQDRSVCASIANRLRASGHAEPSPSTGLISLRTQPVGARVTACRWVASGDGRLKLSAENFDLGTTPITRQPLGLGSWQLIIRHQDCQTIIYPVLSERNQHWGDPSWHQDRFKDKKWDVELPAKDSFDCDAWAFVANGPFLATWPPFCKELDAPTSWAWEEAFLIRKRETTFGEFLPFFLETQSPAAGIKPEDRHFFGPLFFDEGQIKSRFERDPDGELRILEPAGRSREQLMRAAVCGIIGYTANFYAKFVTANTGEQVSLPTPRQWEKAARGVDGRLFPWGNGFDWSYTAGRRSLAQPLGPGSTTLLPGSYPIDKSPYGCLDMAGNAGEWCKIDGSSDRRMPIAGGMLMNTSPFYFAAWPRERLSYLLHRDHLGFRLTRKF